MHARACLNRRRCQRAEVSLPTSHVLASAVAGDLSVLADILPPRPQCNCPQKVCALDFTVTEDRLGVMQNVDLKEGGSEIDVTNDNIGEYVELVLKHRLLVRMRDQLTAFLVGFYEVIPEALLSVFDFQEVELLMCGLPHIDLDDWQRHTEYTGEFERKGANHKVRDSR